MKKRTEDKLIGLTDTLKLTSAVGASIFGLSNPEYATPAILYNLVILSSGAKIMNRAKNANDNYEKGATAGLAITAIASTAVFNPKVALASAIAASALACGYKAIKKLAPKMQRMIDHYNQNIR